MRQVIGMFATFVLLLLQPSSVLAACNADNCARAVTGTRTSPRRPDASSRSADCTEFYITSGLQIPTYATSACGSFSTPASSRYLSACSCFSAVPTTAPLCTPGVTTGTGCCRNTYIVTCSRGYVPDIGGLLLAQRPLTRPLNATVQAVCRDLCDSQSLCDAFTVDADSALCTTYGGPGGVDRFPGNGFLEVGIKIGGECPAECPPSVD